MNHLYAFASLSAVRWLANKHGKATFGFYNRNGKDIECILSAYGK